ncbi:hypothetical protein B566_EDAN017941 [Ephemera danica]|nr:hypothetical protein B566_EDAN017941 [Ephemera danica]
MSQLEVIKENERSLYSKNNATLNNLTACNEAAKMEQEEALNQVKNLDSKLSAALENVTILLSSLNETTATNVINEQNLVTCYNSYNTCSVKEADSLQRNKNITEILKNCEMTNSNLSSQNIKLNLVLLSQNTARNAEDLQKKLISMNLINLMDEIAILRKRNSGLAELNTYITRANGFNREENPTLSLKIKETDQNITHKTNEIYELLQINSNLILSNQNTAKNAEDLQQKVISVNFSLSNLMEEIEKLKEHAELENQHARYPIKRARKMIICIFVYIEHGVYEQY